MVTVILYYKYKRIPREMTGLRLPRVDAHQDEDERRRPRPKAPATARQGSQVEQVKMLQPGTEKVGAFCADPPTAKPFMSSTAETAMINSGLLAWYSKLTTWVPLEPESCTPTTWHGHLKKRTSAPRATDDVSVSLSFSEPQGGRAARDWELGNTRGGGERVV